MSVTRSAFAILAISNILIQSGCAGKGDPAQHTGDPGDSGDSGDLDDPSDPTRVDEDGDGVSPELGDCDDQDATVYQGRDEDCNGRDDNCNGLVDESFADTDGDGTADCEEIEVCDGLDNDGDGLIDEGFELDSDGDGVYDCLQSERCDGLDNDGDGQIDEGFDADGDGYSPCGDAADCDDSDPAVHPGAADLRATEADEDCDGLIDEDDWAPGDLLITEVLANPHLVPDPFAEWLEILNVSDRRVYLDGLTLRTGRGEHRLAEGLRLAVEPGARLVLAPSDDPTENGGVTVDLRVEGLSLQNDSDAVSLEADGLPLAALSWDGTTPGVSLALDPTATAADLADPAWWCGGQAPWGLDTDLGSPGEENPLCPAVDHDGDGRSLEDGDCDDLDAAVHAGAEERWYDGVDQDCDGASDDDADQDGFDDLAHGGDDCDDDDAAIHPGALERCDADHDDEDCDGLVDAEDSDVLGTLVALPDADGDGYGDDSRPSLVCALGAGEVTVGGDCLDSDSGVHPGTTEVWYDGVDQDCDGGSDDDADLDGYDAESRGGRDCDDTDASIRPGVRETWYDGVDRNCDGASDYDRDGDGYDASSFGGTDCDDGDDAISPGVTEVCDPANTDEDCDGLADDADTVAADKIAWYRDSDGDGYGDPAATRWACDAPAGYSADATDCDDRSAAISPGARELWYDGVDGDCDGASDYDADADGWDSVLYSGVDCDDGDPAVNPDALELLADELDNDCDGARDPLQDDVSLYMVSTYSSFGASLAGAGDVDGDGVGDVIIGAPEYDSPSSNTGVVTLFTRLSSGATSSATATATLAGSSSSDYVGGAVAGPGDVDGDGYDDLLIGARGDDSGGYNAGTAFLVAGPVSGTGTLASLGVRLSGTGGSDAAGYAVSGAGDLDGDGAADLLIGAPYVNDTSLDVGAAYVMLGPVTTGVSLGAADARWLGDRGYDYAGTAVRGCGDTDGDGVPDLLVGAPYADASASNSGAAALLLGPATDGGVMADADGLVTGLQASDSLGSALACGGDTDGDGYADLLVGAYAANNVSLSDAGGAWLLPGPVTGSVAASTAALSLWGEGSGDNLGYALDMADVDGDGLSDLLIGAPHADSATANVGAFYLVFGGQTGSLSTSEVDAVLWGGAYGDALGVAVRAAGDTDGDGVDDVLVGSTGDDLGGANAGSTKLLLGRGW